MTLSVHAKFEREQRRVIVLQRDMIHKAERTIEKQRIEIARLKSELRQMLSLARLERNQGKPPRTGQVRPAR